MERAASAWRIPANVTEAKDIGMFVELRPFSDEARSDEKSNAVSARRSKAASDPLARNYLSSWRTRRPAMLAMRTLGLVPAAQPTTRAAVTTKPLPRYTRPVHDCQGVHTI